MSCMESTLSSFPLHPFQMDSPLQEEALAISSIYGPFTFYPDKDSLSFCTSTAQKDPIPVAYLLNVTLEDPIFEDEDNHDLRLRQQKKLQLRVSFPTNYPESAPIHEVVSIYYGTLRLTTQILEEIHTGLEGCSASAENEVVIFGWIEWLRDYLESTLELREADYNHQDNDHQGDKDTDEDQEGEEEDVEEGADENENEKSIAEYFDDDSHSHSHSHHPAPTTSPRISGTHVFAIKTGAPIVDRKSVFVAHLAAITQPGQVPLMIQQLKQENKKVIKATHNIMAYRVENENGTIAQDNDDDGETAAGSRLLHLMSILDVKNVVVVVSRWYGGIPLSADRFKHINNAARILLDECHYIPTIADATGSGNNAGNKKKGGSKKSGKR